MILTKFPICNRALSATEIKVIRDAGQGRQTQGVPNR